MAFDLDALLQRQLYLARYSDTLTTDTLKLLSKTDSKLYALIREFLDKATRRDLAGLQRMGQGSALAQGLLKAIDDLTQTQQAQVLELLSTTFDVLAQKEAAYIQKAMQQPEPVQPSLLPVAGCTLAGALAVLSIRTLQHIKQALVTAIKAETDPIQAIRGTKPQNYKDGVLYARDRDLDKSISFFAMGTVDNVRQQAYEQYKVKQVVWLATLDGRTCKVCANNEANSPYDLGKAPSAPAHPKCRCVLTPHTRSNPTRPYVSDERPVSKIPKDERANKIGQTRLRFDEWFIKQPDEFQRKWLGAERYARFKAGKITLDELTTGDPARVVTLDDLPS